MHSGHLGRSVAWVNRQLIACPRWGLPGAEAVLRLRAIVSNGDLDPYWRFHAAREHERLYPTLDQRRLDLAA